MKQDIILVSSQTKHLTNVCKVLKRFGMDVSQVEKVECMNAGLTSHSPAFFLLDVDLEGAEHFLSELSKCLIYPPPYIMVAGTFPHSKDRVAMLTIGADICIGKPINAEEVLSVVKSVQRRERRLARLNCGKLLSCIKHKELTIDPLRRTVTMRGNQVALTAKEFDILYLLAYREGTVLSKKEIFETIWNETYSKTSTAVSDHIYSLRQKLGLDKKNQDYIQTVFAKGYRFASIE